MIEIDLRSKIVYVELIQYLKSVYYSIKNYHKECTFKLFKTILFLFFLAYYPYLSERFIDHEKRMINTGN